MNYALYREIPGSVAVVEAANPEVMFKCRDVYKRQVYIDKNTNIRQFKNELRWNDAVYRR